MLILEQGVKILLIIFSLFFLIFFNLILGWSPLRSGRKDYFTAFLVSSLWGFVFLMGGFILLIIIVIFWNYIPQFFRFLRQLVGF